jgi:hypothetical protein
MFLGHFAVALGAKKAAPKTSLGTLVFAAQLADLLWPIFLLLGWEQVRIIPGAMAASVLVFTRYPYSHSLLALTLWGVGLGAVYFAIRRNARGAIVLGLCVVSHWLLDFIVHAPDLPLFPGGARYGLGLWNSLAGTLAVELGLFVVGTAIYLRVTRAKDPTGRYALWSLLLFLLVAYIGSLLGPPPPSVSVLAVTALAIWLIVPWAAWADRQHAARAS